MLGNALHRTIAALKRYKWLILATTIFGSAVGFVLSKMIAPKYSVNASVWIREQNQAARFSRLASSPRTSVGPTWS